MGKQELSAARADPDRRSEIAALQEKCQDDQDDLHEKQDELIEAKSELDEDIMDQFGGVVNMLRPVSQGVCQVYQDVLLANGIGECHWNLSRMRGLFGTTI